MHNEIQYRVLYKIQILLCDFNGKIIEFVDQLKYLGFQLTHNLNNKPDIVNRRNKFYNVFNLILRKFHASNVSVFLSIFKSFCIQFYGCELWYGDYKCIMALKQFAVGYHRSIKKIFKIPDSESNHLICEVAGLITFNHHLNLSKIKFIHRTFNNPPYFIKKNFYFMFLNSQLLNEAYSILKNVYKVDDLLNNDLQALKSRVCYVHNSYNDYIFD